MLIGPLGPPRPFKESSTAIFALPRVSPLIQGLPSTQGTQGDPKTPRQATVASYSFFHIGLPGLSFLTHPQNHVGFLGFRRLLGPPDSFSKRAALSRHTRTSAARFCSSIFLRCNSATCCLCCSACHWLQDRRSQQQPGGARRSQEEPGGARWSHEIA